MENDIVIRSQQHGTYHDNTGTDAEYIEHLELKLDKAADEIERLRKEVNTWMGAAERFAESHPQFDAFAYYFKARRDD